MLLLSPGDISFHFEQGGCEMDSSLKTLHVDPVAEEAKLAYEDYKMEYPDCGYSEKEAKDILDELVEEVRKTELSSGPSLIRERMLTREDMEEAMLTGRFVLGGGGGVVPFSPDADFSVSDSDLEDYELWREDETARRQEEIAHGWTVVGRGPRGNIPPPYPPPIHQHMGQKRLWKISEDFWKISAQGNTLCLCAALCFQITRILGIYQNVNLVEDLRATFGA